MDIKKEFKVRLTGRDTINYSDESMEAVINYEAFATNRGGLWEGIGFLPKPLPEPKWNGMDISSSTLRVKKNGEFINVSDTEKEIIISRIKKVFVDQGEKVTIDGK